MMMFKQAVFCTALLLSLPLGLSGALAQPTTKERAAGFGSFGASKEPIKIDADRLDVFDKEGRAVFAGNVVAVQGDSTMNCTLMTVLYEQKRDGAAAGTAAPAGPMGSDDSSIKKIDCKGPVTIVSKTQVATGNDAVFDRVANKIFLIGNAALSDGPNVTRGERVIYDLNTGVANVETAPGGRVRALFVPGSNAPAATPAPAAPAKPKPQKPATN
ncbi:LptA/OstA family protein [Microvirga antarctica]|uniref:LptA/OstA family protein n=1 Tax=Microvirga antarctica TaxID=2819233 RepID=UPI001B30D3DE|nr:LptA/OstA family protein [Microvirga antarctica]